MKNFAKLALFYSFSFIIIFFAALLIRILSSWVDMARLIPVTVSPGEDLTDIAWRALPAAVYLSILISLSYAARKNITIPGSMLGIIILASIFTGGFSLGISRAEALKAVLNPVNPIKSGPGLILSRSESSIILLRESSEIRGPRIVSFPQEPLIYQGIPLGPNNAIISLPPLPLGGDIPWFIHSIDIDMNINGMELKNRFKESYYNFAAYAFSLILLLGSLRFLLELSQWPLANIFLGALVFRGIMALEVFLNSREITALVDTFLAGRAPLMLISPLVLCSLGILLILYTLMSRIARPGRRRISDD